MAGEAADRTEGPEGASPAEPEAPPPPLRILEALLFVGVEPLTAERACALVRGLTPEQFAPLLDALNHAYRAQGRPYRVQPRGPGFELALLPRFRSVQERLHGSLREARLSPAALDVLSLVAYRQPVTRQEIEALRGADSAGPLRQLVRHGLVTVGRRDESRESCYATTPRFLSLFHLRSLDDLPRTEDLEKL